MTTNYGQSTLKAHFSLKGIKEQGSIDSSSFTDSNTSLQIRLLRQNVLWFCQMRWVVSFILFSLGLISHWTNFLPAIGLLPQKYWPFYVSVSLALTNFVYLQLLHHQIGKDRNILLFQMIIDLILITFVVHFLGIIETYAAFAYLFHIILACIFFRPKRSITILLTSIALFTTYFIIDYLQITITNSLFLERINLSLIHTSIPFFHLVTIIILWLTLWYITSHMAKIIFIEDRLLIQANKNLKALQEEKTKHMLRTTHELKAPFAAIQANAQLIAKGYLGQVPSKVIEVTEKIMARCKRLTQMIVDMLQLANIQSEVIEQQNCKVLKLDKRIQTCINSVYQVAKEKQINIRSNVEPVKIFGIKDHIKMLLSNIVLNAIYYSHPQSNINITTKIKGNQVLLTVEDQGIGIHPEKLPKIFEEHYRTEEAIQHNPESTGLGLSIVKHIANMHNIHLSIESEVGKGTKVLLDFPRCISENDVSTTKEDFNV